MVVQSSLFVRAEVLLDEGGVKVEGDDLVSDCGTQDLVEVLWKVKKQTHTHTNVVDLLMQSCVHHHVVGQYPQLLWE